MLNKKQVLIVEDDEILNLALFKVFYQKNYSVLTARNLREAKNLIGKDSIDLAFVDLNLPDGNGMEFLDFIKERSLPTLCIVLTGTGTIEKAVEAMKKGAFHFIRKPFDLKEILNLAEKALSHSFLTEENERLKAFHKTTFCLENFIGKTEAILKITEVIEKISETDSTALIHGVKGTGKKFLAKTIHSNSLRRNKAFITVDCSILSSEVLEEEIFGYMKDSAVSSILSQKRGGFEKAFGGTLYFHEIEHMDPILQVRVLRAIREQSYEKPGSEKFVKVDIRVIASTGKDLEKLVRQNKMREDFYYALNIVPFYLPPLRQRIMDIPLLAQHFLNHCNKQQGKRLSLNQDLIDTLCQYPWPRNLTELKNLIERLTSLKKEGVLEKKDLPKHLIQNTLKGITPLSLDIPEEGINFNELLGNYETNLILKALEATGWNRNQASQLLKMNRTTLVEKIKKKGLKPPFEKET